MSKIRPEDVLRGAEAETAFRSWLDRSRLPYLYATQTRESVPEHFRGFIKRPDYLVALPYVGTLAFDVKSKTAYERGFLFDIAEVRGLSAFDDLFRVSTFFACLDPAGSSTSYWFRLPEVVHCPKISAKGQTVHSVPYEAGIKVDMDRPFQEALRYAISIG